VWCGVLYSVIKKVLCTVAYFCTSLSFISSSYIFSCLHANSKFHNVILRPTASTKSCRSITPHSMASNRAANIIQFIVLFVANVYNSCVTKECQLKLISVIQHMSYTMMSVIKNVTIAMKVQFVLLQFVLSYQASQVTT